MAEEIKEIKEEKPKSAISIVDLHKAYGKKTVLKGLSLEVYPGEFFGFIGRNGIGKSTIMRILSGELIPNLGNYEEEASWDKVIDYYKGSALQNYFKLLQAGEIKTIHKPQMVDQLSKVVKGNVKTLLSNVDERNKLDEYNIYRCPYCGKFHIGHLGKKPKKESE